MLKDKYMQTLLRVKKMSLSSFANALHLALHEFVLNDGCLPHGTTVADN